MRSSIFSSDFLAERRTSRSHVANYGQILDAVLISHDPGSEQFHWLDVLGVKFGDGTISHFAFCRLVVFALAPLN